MEENTKKEVSVETKATDKVKKENKGFDTFFKAHKAEFKKIIWPNRETLTKQTITVIVVSLIVAAFIFGFDTIFEYAFRVANSLMA